MDVYFIAYREGGRSASKQYLVDEGGSYSFKTTGEIVKFHSLFQAIDFFDERKFETENVKFGRVVPNIFSTWDFKEALAEKKKFFG